MPLPTTQRRQPPHVIGIGSALSERRGDGPVHTGTFRGEESRERPGIAEPIRMERDQRGGRVTALGDTDDTMPARSQALVGGKPIRQLTGQEGLPLLAGVLLPVG